MTFANIFVRTMYAFFLFVTAASACTPETVAGATEQGFMATIMSCLVDPSLPVDGGSQLCLGQFIADNAEDNPYPITGACRTAYATLVDSWSASACAFESFPSEECLAGLSEGMFAFYDSAGYFPFYPQCTIDAIRQYARSSSYEVITNEYTASGGSWQTAAGSTSICDFCYANVFAPYVLVQAEADAVWADTCNSDITACMLTTPMGNALGEFERCAGAAIDFLGPVCTPSQVAAVELMIPRPYFEFTNCAYHPTKSYCANVNDYLDSIESSTGSAECDLCYAEFRTDIETLVNTIGETYCAEDVFADDCLGYHQSALYNFQTCSGSTIAASVTMSPGTVTTTQTTSRVTTVSTVASTTKSSRTLTFLFPLVALIFV